MDLKFKIAHSQPRETSGSNSSSRFDYQKDWTLGKLLDQHASGEDYIAVFDWHEDLIIMDSEVSPQKVNFYQIKGKKSGNWSLTSLLKSSSDTEDNPLLSIIGKLYDCKAKYELETSSLNFVSNARFNFSKLADGKSSLSEDDICVLHLSNNDKKKILEKVKTEHSLNTDPIYEDLMFFRVVDLSLNDSQTHTMGKISTFLESMYPNQKFNLPSVYRMLFDEVRRRSNYNKTIYGYDELVSNKAIGRKTFDAIIAAAGIGRDYQEIWKSIAPDLADLGFIEKRNIEQGWKLLEIEKMAPGNTFLDVITKKVKDAINESEEKGDFKDQPLLNCLNHVERQIVHGLSGSTNYAPNFLKALILFELYEKGEQ